MTKLSIILLTVFGVSVLASLIWALIRFGIIEIIFELFELLESIVDVFLDD